MTTTGYKLTDGRYFIVTGECGEAVTIKQVFFESGIYPAPVKDVPESLWPDVLALVSYSAL